MIEIISKISDNIDKMIRDVFEFDCCFFDLKEIFFLSLNGFILKGFN